MANSVDADQLHVKNQGIVKPILEAIQNMTYFQDECQKVWIPDEATHFVGLHLGLNYLRKSSTVFKIYC